MPRRAIPGAFYEKKSVLRMHPKYNEFQVDADTGPLVPAGCHGDLVPRSPDIHASPSLGLWSLDKSGDFWGHWDPDTCSLKRDQKLLHTQEEQKHL